MARRLARWTVRGIRAALAVVAGAALVAWAMSAWHAGYVRLLRMTATDDRAEGLHLAADCVSGRLGFAYVSWAATGPELAAAKQNMKLTDPGWTARAGWGSTTWLDRNTARTLGPLQWRIGDLRGDGFASTDRTLSVPCWLLALLTGAWPLASAAAFIRRRRRASLRRRLNLCRHCGYDLRATPSPDGELLATCPECGMTAGNDEVRNSKSESMTKREGRMTKRSGRTTKR